MLFPLAVYVKSTIIYQFAVIMAMGQSFKVECKSLVNEQGLLVSFSQQRDDAIWSFQRHQLSSASTSFYFSLASPVCYDILKHWNQSGRMCSTSSLCQLSWVLTNSFGKNTVAVELLNKWLITKLSTGTTGQLKGQEERQQWLTKLLEFCLPNYGDTNNLLSPQTNIKLENLVSLPAPPRKQP